MQTRTLDEQRDVIDTLFLSSKTFESELFLTNDDFDIRESMKLAAKEIMNNPKAKATVNFLTLPSYNNFRIEGFVLALKDLISDELEYLVLKEAGFDQVIVDEIKADKTKQTFLMARAKEYFLKYQNIFKEAVADTFFDRILKAPQMKMVDSIIQEVIDGVGRFAPVLVQASGVPLANKDEQLWMRLKQAEGEKNKELAKANEDVERLTRQVAGIDLNIQALEKARNITVDYLKELGNNQIKEAVINEDGSLTELKRVMQFLPAGEVAFYAAEQMDRGRRNASNEIARAEWIRATKFYENCNINNTEKELNIKGASFLSEKPQKRQALEKAEAKLKDIEDRRVDNFDQTLIKIREAFVKNIGKTRL